jgi:hypothetical protein
MFRFSGHFFVNDLNLAGFPFYDMNLTITMETRSVALSCYEGGPPCISLVPESNVSKILIGQFADVNGYDKVGSLVKPFQHQYNITFGTCIPYIKARESFRLQVNKVGDGGELLAEQHINRVDWKFQLAALIALALLLPLAFVLL